VNSDIIENAMDAFTRKNKVTLINNQLISQLYID